MSFFLVRVLKKAPYKTIAYDLNSNKISETFMELRNRKVIQKEIVYKNGVPSIEKIIENGILTSEKKL